MSFSLKKLEKRLVRQKQNLPAYQKTLGISDEMMRELVVDAESVVYMNWHSEQAAVALKRTDEIMHIAMYGSDDEDDEDENGEPREIPPFPVIPQIEMPHPVRPGITPRMYVRSYIIKAHPNFNEETGDALAIQKYQPPPPNDLETVCAVKVADGGFTVTITDGGAQFYKVQIRRANAENWQDFAVTGNSTCKLSFIPLNPANPERIAVRIIPLAAGSILNGNPSAAVSVTIR